MVLSLPPNIEKEHTPAWAALHLAIGQYVSGEFTLGQAAEVAGLSQWDFQGELGKRRICHNYSLEDLEADLAAVKEVSGQ